MREIDTVLFDLDDTLHDDTDAYHRAARRVAEEVAQAHGILPELLFQAYVGEARAFWRSLSVTHLAVAIEDARVALWEAALAHVALADRTLAAGCADRYTDYRAELLAPSPGAHELLVALRERGCKLGIVSNGFAATHHRKIEVLGLRPLVDGVFLADEMGMVKPDPEIFRHVCRTLASEPARTAMVGDRYDRDIIGAGTVGLFTVLIDIHAIPLPEGARPPDAVVPSLDAVLSALPLAARQGASSGAQKRSEA
jgi:putative hydrolase of the HAD superfamily